MGTTSMKSLRVLTGAHAGAQIRLTQGSYRVSAADDADICIGDWREDEVTLTVGGDGVARVHSHNGDEVLVADFIAVPFGDVVLCVGPDDTAWPRDLDLLAGLWKTAEPATPHGADAHGNADGDGNVKVNVDGGTPADDLASAAPRTLGWRAAAVAIACTAAIGGLTTAGIMLAGTQPSEAAYVKVDADALSKQVTEALHRAGLADLNATARDGNVEVTGIVSGTDDSVKARRIMDDLARGKVLKAYDVAQQDVDDIQQSLAGTGAQVSYAGKGVFRISGKVKSMSSFRERVAGVRADLDSNIRRVDVDVKEARSPIPDIEYTEVVATGGLRYIETPDGTKHLFDSAGSDSGNN
jgi:type III secretion protein D